MKNSLEGRIAVWSGKTLKALALLPLAVHVVWASGPGTTTGELLKIPIGTRAVGMGEAFTALADDSSSIYWNPAGMSQMGQKEASFMHSALIEGVHYEHLGFVSPGDNYAVGTNFSYLGYGDIAGYNNNAQPTGNVGAYSYVFNGAVSRMFTPALSLGLSGGLVHETLAEDSANTFAVNAGSLYQLPAHPWNGNYRLALAVQNLGPGLKFVSERAPLPRKIKMGASAQGINKWPLNLTTDISIPNDNKTYLSLGSEYWFKEMVALRLGYAGSNDEGRGLRIGIGLKYGGMLFDYAYAGYGDFGATNRVSFSMRFGDRVRQLNAGERAILKEAKLSEKDGAYVPAIIAYDELLDRDPTNDHILHYMINAHDKLARQEAEVNVAERSVPIPSPEDAAMAELLPETSPENPAIAQGTSRPAIAPEAIGDDPLDLNKLPEVSTLDVSVSQGRQGSGKPALSAPAPSYNDDPSAEPRSAPDSNSPALSRSDIYGNP